MQNREKDGHKILQQKNYKKNESKKNQNLNKRINIYIYILSTYLPIKPLL